MTKRYFKATDGTRTYFRATATRAYLSMAPDTRYGLTWSGSAHLPLKAVEITGAEFRKLVAIKNMRTSKASPQHSWVPNEALEAAPVTLTAEWNTLRAYTAAGQIIKAELQEDGSILFADTSRQVDGRVAAGPGKVRTADDLQRVVMSAYDANRYTRDHASWQFLMMPSKREG